ncbi:hypothetical protein [Candidatus Poriferisodalis sp.]|uniref:hypothetical protein n=1 Tax=Candidatus Poriferisodalis sp. TaxID=3101277 RepID=UPI003B012486
MSPAAARPGGDRPLPWALREGVSTAVTLFVLVAAVGVVLAVWLTRGGEPASALPAGLQSVTPVPGANVPHQSPVGARLEAGWRMTLSINGTTIPAVQLNAGTVQLGEYLFSAGDGKAITKLRSGRSCARLTATPTIDVEAADFTYEWCFTTF